MFGKRLYRKSVSFRMFGVLVQLWLKKARAVSIKACQIYSVLKV